MIPVCRKRHDPALALSGAGLFAAPASYGWPGVFAALTRALSPSVV
jgi:hypothetical protein